MIDADVQAAAAAAADCGRLSARVENKNKTV